MTASDRAAVDQLADTAPVRTGASGSAQGDSTVQAGQPEAQPQEGAEVAPSGEHPVGHEDLLALARAVAAPTSGAMLLRPNTRGGKDPAGWTSIEDAVRGDQAFAVSVDPEVIAADIDAGDAALVAEAFGDVIRHAGYTPVVVASGGEGRRHVFARIPEDGLRTRLAAEGRARGLDMRTTIRPPLSRHPAGLPVRLLSPSTVAGAKETLCRTPLHDKWFELLRSGGAGEDRSGDIQAFLTAVVNAGYPKAWAEKALFDTHNKLGEKLRQIVQEHGERAAQKWFDLSWKKAVAFVEHNPKGLWQAEAALQRARALVEESRFTGKGGSTDHAVLLAHLEIGTTIGSTSWEASDRQIAEAAGVRSQTVTAAHRRLVERGYLGRVAKGRGTKASSWTLGGALKRQPRNRTTKSHTPPWVVLSGAVLRPGHDAARWSALGLTATQLYKALEEGPFTTRELAERTGFHRSTVARNMERLKVAKLAVQERETKRWWRKDVSTRDLEEVARTYGTHGAGVQQQIRHELEREIYRQNRTARYRARGITKKAADGGRSDEPTTATGTY